MSKRESFGSTLRSDLLTRLRNMSDETGIPISKLLDKAVLMLLDDHGSKINELPTLYTVNVNDGTLKVVDSDSFLQYIKDYDSDKSIENIEKKLKKN